MSNSATDSTNGPATNGSSPNPYQTILANLPKTKHLYQLNSYRETCTLETTLTSCIPFDSLTDEDKLLLKTTHTPASIAIYALTFEATICHPQGGGQASDTADLMVSPNKASASSSEIEPFFKVLHVRSSITHPWRVLHFGHFTETSSVQPDSTFPISITQQVDSSSRHLYSRLHTAGHVLGASTRKLLESRIENFDELKASHFPDAASCEFRGSIEGKYKGEIQAVVDELVERDAEIKIGWWRKREFRQKGLERLLPSDKMWAEMATVVDENGDEVGRGDDSVDDEETRIRIVNIVGAEIYPCGGTHVASTKKCGKIGVKKISRQKGNSRVSYTVD